MKAIQQIAFGLESLQLTDLPTPTPAANEVLVKIEAVALNYLDVALATGTYSKELPLPRIPTSDGAGIVAAVGDKVSKWQPGDRVMIQYNQLWQRGLATPATNHIRTGVSTPGLLAEYAVIPEYALVRTPANLTSAEAATLPVAGVTAWTGLMSYANIQPGQTVLTQGTGGVSLFALQIALAAGARVIATSSNPAKLEKLKQLGAHEVIDYKQYPNWHEEVSRLTNGEGVHATLDIAGAATIVNSVKSVGYNGFVGLVGFIAGAQLPLDLFTIVGNYIRLQGYSVGSVQSFEALAAAIALNNIHPVIDRIFPVSEVQEAFRHMGSGNYFGKIVIDMNA
ncbi:NAD(P)-dependent alcohol dehydrogenase [Chitinophaga polysaccharea]|uniref:zinc-dependent alcohol dehydrogenase family protein n=1 Tax=Chitinophaga TaxID=79328 RepID=UPI0014557ADC|nr:MULTISPECIES: NAD(P)-dependent alcohol dehydrogenase [Chitinophaga]NLR61611.1 NAD(P)-dependent alcohol dehydrogenase [Chitinophaga polysaccharea]NLU93794.1 NAD(P)-dependent alcohol dehydrogenase [Chitinophaga sp. Ak27]